MGAYVKSNSQQLASGPLPKEILDEAGMGGIIDGNIAQYKDYEVVVEDPRNFIMRKKDGTDEIQITIREDAKGEIEWVGLPACI